MKRFSLTTGFWTLVIYTITLSLLAVARGSVGTPGFFQRVILVALSGFLVGFFLYPLARTVQGSTWARFGKLAILIFGLASISNALETVLYLPAVDAAGNIVGGIVQAVILAAALAFVTRPVLDRESSKNVKLRSGQIAIFILSLAVAWLPVYFLFETLDTPIVHLLEHGSSGVFSHPNLAVIISLELARGIVHAVVMLWIALLARGRQSTTWLWGSLAIALLNGWAPILPTSTLPLGIRIANGFEITLSSIAFAGIASYLFARLMRRRSVVA
jgi:hypothetical protein